MTKLEAWKAWCESAGTPNLATEFTLEQSSHGKAFSFAWERGVVEREKVAAWMMAKGYATGHGDTIEELLQELDWQIKEKQEPVTFVCSTGLCRLTLTQTNVGIGDTQAIRARSEL